MKISLYFLLLLFFIVALFFINGQSKISGFVPHESIFTYIRLEPEYSKVRAGDNIILGIRLVRLGGEGRKDVTLNFLMKKKDGQFILINSQTVAVETQASFVNELNIPEELKKDSYSINVEVRDVETGELISSATQRILVFDNLFINFSERNVIWIIIIASAFIIFALLIVIIKLLLKKDKSEEKLRTHKYNNLAKRVS